MYTIYVRKINNKTWRKLFSLPQTKCQAEESITGGPTGYEYKLVEATKGRTNNYDCTK